MKLAINLALSFAMLALCMWLVWPDAATRHQLRLVLENLEFATFAPYLAAYVGLLVVVQLTRAGGPEALAGIVEAPHVEIRHLGTLDRNHAKALTGAHGPRATAPARDHEAVDQRPVPVFGQTSVERAIGGERGSGLGLVDHAGWGHGVSFPVLLPARRAGAGALTMRRPP